MRRHLLIALSLGATLALGGLAPAQADPLVFTWSPSSIISLGGTISNANNFTGTDTADITVNGTTFNENAVFLVTNFYNGGNQVASSGLGLNGGAYSLYATLSATGNTPGLPAVGSGLSATGDFISATYTMWIVANPNLTVTNVTGGTPIISGATGAIALFGGTLQSGTDTITAVSGASLPNAYSPQANLNLTLTACTSSSQVLASGANCTGDESGFWVNPAPSTVSLVVSNFSATTSVTTTNLSTSPATIDISGGGGNVTFAVLEPTSVFLFGSGLIALGMVRRRRRA